MPLARPEQADRFSEARRCNCTNIISTALQHLAPTALNEMASGRGLGRKPQPKEGAGNRSGRFPAAGSGRTAPRRQAHAPRSGFGAYSPEEAGAQPRQDCYIMGRPPCGLLRMVQKGILL